MVGIYDSSSILYVFGTEVPIILKDLSVENLQRFIDLCCQQVEQYQDGILIRRPYKSGKHNKWMKSKFPKYKTKNSVDPMVSNVYKYQSFYQQQFPNLNHLFPKYMRALRDNITQQMSYCIDNQESTSNREILSPDDSNTVKCSLPSAINNTLKL